MKTTTRLYSQDDVTGVRSGRAISVDTRVILEEASRLGVAIKEVVGTECFSLEYEGVKQYLRWQVPLQTSALAQTVTDRKDYTISFLRESGIAVSRSYILFRHKPEQWKDVFGMLSKPIVLKPIIGTHGKGVVVGIESEEKFLEIVSQYFSEHESEYRFLAEEMFAGEEYRILATPEKVIGITNRVPANVMGDGRTSIAELIEEKNKDERRGVVGQKALVNIDADGAMKDFLMSKGRSFEDVPGVDEQVFLRPLSNIAQGGDSIDVTDGAHSSVQDIALRVMRAIPGLAIAGIDFMTKDISAPQNDSTYIVIEVNSSPALSMHDYPYEGKNRGAAKEFLSLMFPGL